MVADMWLGRTAIWTLPVVVGLAACGPGPSGYPYAKEPDPRSMEYVLGPPDEISIRVWRNADLSGTVRIRPDGAITVPLIGEIRAAGRTSSELGGEIQRQLKAYIKDESAVVSVAVVAATSYRITVLGRVGAPRILTSNHYLTISEAVALAGGTTPFARLKYMVLVRHRPDGTVVRIPIRYDLIATGLSPEQNLVLMTGDQLYVP